jgi:hypothetical protein
MVEAAMQIAAGLCAGVPVPGICDELARSQRGPRDRANRLDAYFLMCGLWPAGVLPEENGDGVAPPFFMFLSAFGFFFSLLLRI